MKAAVYNRAKGTPELVEVPIPEINDGEILIKPMACGVCGSDVLSWNLAGQGSFGHELAAYVVKVGKGVKNVKEGDRVFVHHRVPCLICHYCRRGHYTMCPRYLEYGFDPGAFAEYSRVRTRNVQFDTIKLPDHISFEEGCLIEPLACCWRTIKRTNLQPGDTVVVMGAGFAGLVGVEVAKILGAGLVIVSDFVDFKLDKAKELGADVVINPGKEDVLEKIKEVNEGRKADIVLITPSSLPALKEGIRLAEKGGTITQFGPTGPDESFSMIPHDFFFQELTYSPSYSSSPIETKTVATFIFQGKIKVLPLITHHFKLDQIMEALELKKKATDSLKIIIHPHDEE